MSNMQKEEHVIIIGAGAAGLMAARELSLFGRVTVLEARNQSGGRIRTLRHPAFAAHIEEGAEFVHGELPLTCQLLKEAGLDFTAMEGNMYRVAHGEWSGADEMIGGWDELLEQMNKEEDITLSLFLERYYGQEKDAMLRERVIKYAQGFDLADPTRVCVKALYDEWTNEEPENFRIEKGYMALIEFLEGECRRNHGEIYMNCVVKRIVWEEGKVTVYTENNASFCGQKVLVTVPLGVLQQEQARAGISFIPAINDYMNAAKAIGFGSVIKLILQFNRLFWNEYKSSIGFIVSDQEVPTWWTQQPDDKPVLTGWLGGPPADRPLATEELLEQALHSLAGIFQMEVSLIRAMFTAGRIVNWRNDEWTMGAYSYATPLSSRAKKLLNEPVKNTVYFAGEALYEGKSPGTVEAALDSGKKIAAKIMGQ